KYTVTQFEYGDIERTTAKVEHGDLVIVLVFIETVSKRGGCRFVYDMANGKPGDLACFFSSLSLGVIKIGRNGDHGFRYFLSQVIFSCLFHFLKYHCA